MWLNACLEEINRLRSVSINRHFLTTCVVNLRHLVNERNDVAKELHQTADTHTLHRTYAEYREDRTGNKSLTYTLTHLVLCQSLCLEELIHKSLVILSSSLHESLVHLHRLIHLLCRNLLYSRSTAFRSP